MSLLSFTCCPCSGCLIPACIGQITDESLAQVEDVKPVIVGQYIQYNKVIIGYNRLRHCWVRQSSLS